jgi:hypothetical protein
MKLFDRPFMEIHDTKTVFERKSKKMKYFCIL